MYPIIAIFLLNPFALQALSNGRVFDQSARSVKRQRHHGLFSFLL
jgi:hypothetical protein